jgi:sarcosine oxidase, subunit alpha
MRFTFDGAEYEGRPGDTLAAALVRAGVDVVAHSIYRGRPRGIYAAGADEPNALVQVELAGGSEPMLRATEVELFDGLIASGLDGRGRLDAGPDPARYDHRHVYCDVLVVGGGAAGLAAADAAARTDARVILVEDQPVLGGALLVERGEIDGAPALEWVDAVRERLEAAPEARVLTRACAIGHYDANLVVVAERLTDHLGAGAPAGAPRQRLWQIRARQVVLATGAHERAPVFAGNDRPGIMLASAARAYATRWDAPPGRTAVVFTTNDSGHDVARDLRAAGIEVADVVDARDARAIVGTLGESRLVGVDVMELSESGAVIGERRRIACDLLAVAGGWNPALHLFSQSGGSVRYDAARGCYVPGAATQPVRAAGACAGTFDLAGCLAEGTDAGAEAASAFANGSPPRVPVAAADDERPARTLWLVPAPDGETWDEHFADLQRDATVADIRRAAAAGMRSPEHVKRFTTIGTANDQGRTSGVATLGVLAATLGADMADLGPTTYRPPYVPVSFALLAGRNRGELSDPIRQTPIHTWHVEHGAVFEDVGQWKRPWYYPRAGEDMDAAVLRECAAARTSAACMDASTLGKIDVVGPDAVEFLNRLYTGDFSKLKPGMCKYGLLCHADGMVFDDGVSMRLADDRFLVTTTTGNAAAVLDWFEEWLQTEWPELRVRCTSVTEQWATVAVVGPRSRDVVGAVVPGVDVAQEAFPFMAIRHGTTADGIPARVCRVSFSGELAYEINVAGAYGRTLWEAVMAAGEPHAITPYGTETMHVLRAEKGYVIVGQDTDGTVTPHDLGLSWMVSKVKGDFVGRRSFARPDTARGDRKHFVGLLPEDPDERLPEGAQLVLDPSAPVPVPMAGHVTSSYRSAALGRTFALGLLERGRELVGETVHAPLGDRTVPVLVTDPVFYDPEGARRDG